MNRAISAAMLGIAVAAATVFGASSATAAKPGTVKASKSVVSAVVADTGTTTPATCFAVVLSRSDRSWGVMALMGGDNWQECGWVVEGGALVRKVKGKWTFVEDGYGVLSSPCSVLRKTLEANGAKKSVYSDLKSHPTIKCI